MSTRTTYFFTHVHINCLKMSGLVGKDQSPGFQSKGKYNIGFRFLGYEREFEREWKQQSAIHNIVLNGYNLMLIHLKKNTPILSSQIFLS